MTITFRCGHVMSAPDALAAAPRCGICGETVVSRVAVRPPSFVGRVRGPYAKYEDLGALPVSLRAPKEQRDA
jgi:hypothetical protein